MNGGPVSSLPVSLPSGYETLLPYPAMLRILRWYSHWEADRLDTDTRACAKFEKSSSEAIVVLQIGTDMQTLSLMRWVFTIWRVDSQQEHELDELMIRCARSRSKTAAVPGGGGERARSWLGRCSHAAHLPFGRDIGEC